MVQFSQIRAMSKVVPIPPESDALSAYVFSEKEILAVEAAIASHRPLLLRAAPGHPRREFAIAVARFLNWGFIEVDVEEHPDFQTLLWSFDAELRQAEAGIVGAMLLRPDEIRERLDKTRFIAPGPLWWVFDPLSARPQAELFGGAHPELPSAGNLQFVLFVSGLDYVDDRYLRRMERLLVRGYFDGPLGQMVRRSVDSLVVLTTDEERKIPDTLIRHCLVMFIPLPDARIMMEWAKAVVPELTDDVIHRATDSILLDREFAFSRAIRPPGLYDYLDLLRTVAATSSSPAEQVQHLNLLLHFWRIRTNADLEPVEVPEPVWEPVEVPELVVVPQPTHHCDQPSVFISYASSVEDGFVQNLYDFLVSEGIKAKIDKVDLAYRESVGNYIDELGLGSAVVVVVSDKYLRSPWCMWELLKIYEAREFRERVFPVVLADADITSGTGRLAYAEYWEDRLRKLEAAMRKVDPLSIASATVEEGRRIREFAGKVDLLASMVADMSFQAMQDLSAETLQLLGASLASRLRKLGAAP